MRDLLKPFELVWTWASTNFGLPGQLFLLSASVILGLGLIAWVSNRRGAVG
jgi:hypothetical protein